MNRIFFILLIFSQLLFGQNIEIDNKAIFKKGFGSIDNPAITWSTIQGDQILIGKYYSPKDSNFVLIVGDRIYSGSSTSDSAFARVGSFVKLSATEKVIFDSLLTSVTNTVDLNLEGDQFGIQMDNNTLFLGDYYKNFGIEIRDDSTVVFKNLKVETVDTRIQDYDPIQEFSFHPEYQRENILNDFKVSLIGGEYDLWRGTDQDTLGSQIITGDIHRGYNLNGGGYMRFTGMSVFKDLKFGVMEFDMVMHRDVNQGLAPDTTDVLTGIEGSFNWKLRLVEAPYKPDIHNWYQAQSYFIYEINGDTYLRMNLSGQEQGWYNATTVDTSYAGVDTLQQLLEGWRNTKITKVSDWEAKSKDWVEAECFQISSPKFRHVPNRQPQGPATYKCYEPIKVHITDSTFSVWAKWDSLPNIIDLNIKTTYYSVQMLVDTLLAAGYEIRPISGVEVDTRPDRGVDDGVYNFDWDFERHMPDSLAGTRTTYRSYRMIDLKTDWVEEPILTGNGSGSYDIAAFTGYPIDIWIDGRELLHTIRIAWSGKKAWLYVDGCGIQLRKPDWLKGDFAHEQYCDTIGTPITADEVIIGDRNRNDFNASITRVKFDYSRVPGWDNRIHVATTHFNTWQGWPQMMQQLNFYRDNGHSFIRNSTLIDYMNRRIPSLPPNPIKFTIDDNFKRNATGDDSTYFWLYNTSVEQWHANGYTNMVFGISTDRIKENQETPEYRDQFWRLVNYLDDHDMVEFASHNATHEFGTFYTTDEVLDFFQQQDDTLKYRGLDPKKIKACFTPGGTSTKRLQLLYQRRYTIFEVWQGQTEPTFLASNHRWLRRNTFVLKGAFPDWRTDKAETWDDINLRNTMWGNAKDPDFTDKRHHNYTHGN